MTTPTLLLDTLMGEAGAARWGCADACEVDRQARERYDCWIAGGCHGSMAYLERYADLRSDPTLLEPGTRTVIAAAFPYGTPPAGEGDDGLRFAAYALGDDYHEVVRRRLDHVAEGLRRACGEAENFRVCVDTAPLRERYWAHRAGLGIIGLNNQLIVPGAGSYLFLGFILTTLRFPPSTPIGADCGLCGRCVRSCPGGAIGGDGSFDARRCLSYLTIEHRGELPPGIKIGNRVYGCDVCQQVCPHNMLCSPPPPLPEFAPRQAVTALTAGDIAAMDQAAFSRIFSHSAVKRTKLAGLKRNAAYIENEKNNRSDQLPDVLKVI